MVGVLVDHDLIAAPVPTYDDVIIVRGDVPVPIVKPEALRVPAGKVEHMFRSKATREGSVPERLIEVVMRIIAAAIVSDPLIVISVNVRNFRMPLLVHGKTVLGPRSGLLPF